MKIEGYKAFNIDKTNRYGKSFVEGETYHIEGKVKFGSFGCGFHLCTELADVFRYVDDNVLVAKVTGSGNCLRYDDEYYGYYDMYVVSTITINKFLTREEIINLMLYDNGFNIEKFLATFRLNEQEKVLFWEKFSGDYRLSRFLLYFQFGFKQAFDRDALLTSEEILKLKRRLEDGQNNNKGSKGK